MKRTLLAVATLALLAGTPALVRADDTNAATQAADQTGVRKIKFYQSTMNPGETSPTPANDNMGMKMKPVYEEPTTNAVVKPYPLDYCIVSGDKIGGDMGKPITNNYMGQQIIFCCSDCPPKFKKDPEKYMKKLAEAEAKMQKETK